MPYAQYETLDNLMGVRAREREEEEEKRQMHAQPETLIKGDNLPAVAALDMSYKPKMKQQPTMQFQTNLDFGAALPAVASDTAWNDAGGETSDSIAPSIFQAAASSLPSIEDAMGPMPELSAAALHHPLLPLQLQHRRRRRHHHRYQLRSSRKRSLKRSLKHSLKRSLAQPQAQAPPPPMPAPAAKKCPPPPEADSTGRSGLMDAIRGAGGLTSRKKRAKERRVKEQPAAAKPMSLAEEMREKLLRRQGAISGRGTAQRQKKRRMTVTAKLCRHCSREEHCPEETRR